MNFGLTRVVQWGHELLAEIVCPGDLVVDLTAGNGQDTLVLYQLTGAAGQVVAFDIQSVALHLASDRLQAAGAEVRMHGAVSLPLPRVAGIDLLQMSHADLVAAVSSRPKAVIANLGYLPGGRRELTTRPETTLAALQQSCELLEHGGRLAVVAYPGHPGGAEEAAAVTDFFAALDERAYQVLELKVVNRPSAPFLLIAEKL